MVFNFPKLYSAAKVNAVHPPRSRTSSNDFSPSSTIIKAAISNFGTSSSSMPLWSSASPLSSFESSSKSTKIMLPISSWASRNSYTSSRTKVNTFRKHPMSNNFLWAWISSFKSSLKQLLKSKSIKRAWPSPQRRTCLSRRSIWN
jgi:hypothetical protein